MVRFVCWWPCVVGAGSGCVMLGWLVGRVVVSFWLCWLWLWWWCVPCLPPLSMGGGGGGGATAAAAALRCRRSPPPVCCSGIRIRILFSLRTPTLTHTHIRAAAQARSLRSVCSPGVCPLPCDRPPAGLTTTVAAAAHPTLATIISIIWVVLCAFQNHFQTPN